jgi:chromosomal replication initiation ATPase DnaA
VQLYRDERKRQEEIMITAYAVPEISLNKKKDIVIRNVCDYYGVTPEEIKGRSRKKKISDSRQMVIFLLVRDYKLTTSKAGLLVRRDHATAIHSVKVIEDRITLYKNIKEDLDKIRMKIHGVFCPNGKMGAESIKLLKTHKLCTNCGHSWEE